MRKVQLLLVLILGTAMLLAACGPANGNGGELPGNNTGALPPDDGAAAGDEVPQTGEMGTCDAQTLVTAGQSLYTDQCAGCHGQEGEGAQGFPPLAGDMDLTTNDAVAVFESYMAVDAHPKDLSADELAAVLTYSRSSFGNTGEVICPDVLPVTMQ